MTRVNKYDTYKDSGIEWVGEIPTTWQKVRLRFLCNIQTGDKDTVNKVDDGMYPFYVRSPIVERINTYTFDGEAILTAGDGVGAGKVFHYVTGKFDYHQRVYNLHNFKRIFGKFLYLYLKENFYKEIEKSNAKSTVDSIRLPMLLNFPVVFPVDTVEQQVIADYLDKKCGEIDKVVETEKAVIEKLKEYKQSIITEVVTKGLDKSVPLKDSGIEWIGKIPEHWEVCRLKNYAKIQNGQDFKSVENDNGSIPVIGSGGEFARANEWLYHGESILLGRKGTIDKPLYVNCAFWTVDTMYYTQLENITFGKYFYYLCKTINFDFYQYGSAVPSMTQRDLNSVRFPLPKKDEQRQIADYLDNKCSEIDKVISDKEQLIEKLTEYKKSLIYECVTGKRKVVA